MRFFLLLALFSFNVVSISPVLAKDTLESEKTNSKEPISIEADIKNSFSIESGAGLFLAGSYTTAPLFNITVLFPNDFDDRFNYFIDHSLSPAESSPIADGAQPLPQLAHVLLLGGRFYLDFPHDFISPYFSVGVGAVALHNLGDFGSFLAIPIVNGGLGVDYMFTEKFGLNIELSLLLIILRGKASLKYVF